MGEGEFLLAAVFLVVVLIAARRCLPLLQLEHALRRARENIRPAGRKWKRRDAPQSVTLRRLNPEDRTGFLRAWHSVRRQFENDPNTALLYADLLISGLLRDPAGSLSPRRRAETLLEGQLKDKYLAAHDITLHNTPGPMKPNELKRAMGLYEVLFDELMNESNAPNQVRRIN
jgi:hypothetical protein